MEEVEKSVYFSPQSFYQNISQGQTSAQKLTEADKSSATSLLERAGNCLKLLQVKRDSNIFAQVEKIFCILGKSWSFWSSLQHNNYNYKIPGEDG